MGDVTLEQLNKICGNYTSKSGENYFFQCPICRDTHRDNLVFNSKRQIIKCFKDSSHTLEVLRMINKNNKENNEFSINYKPLKENEFSIKQPKETPVWEIRQPQYIEYLQMTQELLLNDKELLSYIYQKRGLKQRILDLCGVGYDNTEDCFTIPIFSLKYDCITDFELRYRGEQKKIRRIGGGCSTIARIWGVDKAKTCYIVEGFIDGITLAQFLLEKKNDSFTIYSCSNGVSSLLSCMSEINFSNFEDIKLILDNDEAGDGVTKAIIERYPFIIDSRQFLRDENVKDFNDWYLKKGR